jgi:hypothetical protein
VVRVSVTLDSESDSDDEPDELEVDDVVTPPSVV